MEVMSEEKLQAIIENEMEWRRHLLKKMEGIEKEQRGMLLTLTTLKLKIGAISSVFGLIGGLVMNYFHKKL
jgi:hypothetical protein